MKQDKEDIYLLVHVQFVGDKVLSATVSDTLQTKAVDYAFALDIKLEEVIKEFE